jgi:hypothetical protein
MQVEQLLNYLEANGDSPLRIALPGGENVPDHFHVTEVGRIDKNFIDCGGTQRNSTSCVLQAWTADDTHHRLVAGKLAKILRLANSVLKSTDLPVEMEYGEEIAIQYVLADIEVVDRELHLKLKAKQTDCLARDRCGVGDTTDVSCCSPTVQLKI